MLLAKITGGHRGIPVTGIKDQPLHAPNQPFRPCFGSEHWLMESCCEKLKHSGDSEHL